MVDPEKLRRALRDFDGKHVAPLRDVVADGLTPEAEAELFAALDGPHQVAATWIAKAMVERDLDAGRILPAINSVTQGDAILHVLQCVQHAPKDAGRFSDRFRTLMSHKKTLVRVWALDALVRVSEPGEAKKLIADAGRDASASIRARARNLAKEFFGDT